MSTNKTLEVNVTAKHIEEGKRGVCAECPIALAIREAYPELLVSVGITECKIGHYSYDLPQEAITFIRRFDFQSFYLCPKPFKFRLENGKPTTFWL